MQVVSSFSILADLVRSVAGDHVEVLTLVGPGQDAHTFEPAPTHGVALNRAALVFENGLGFEGWLDKLYTASGSKARRVKVTDGIAAQKAGHAHAASGDEAAHAHGELDPHVWQDVRHAIHVVGRVRDALIELDPTNAPAYRTNAERSLAELTALDAWVVEQVRVVPEPRRTLVTHHESFGYFCSRYGFAIVGTAFPGVSTEAAEPSAADLARLVRRVRSAGVPVIFPENVGDPKVLERVAREAGVKVGPPLYGDALDAPGGPVDSYPKLVRHNVAAIVSALTG